MPAVLQNITVAFRLKLIYYLPTLLVLLRVESDEAGDSVKEFKCVESRRMGGMIMGSPKLVDGYTSFNCTDKKFQTSWWKHESSLLWGANNIKQAV